jgi:hypothetical protein
MRPDGLGKPEWFGPGAEKKAPAPKKEEKKGEEKK